MNGTELEESKEERGPGSPGNRQVERERAVCKRGQDRKCYTGPDFQVIPFQRQRHLHWAVPVQAICEAAPGICGSSLVTLTGKGQGGARRGAKKGSQVRLWCASPRLSGAPEGAGLDLTGGEEADMALMNSVMSQRKDVHSCIKWRKKYQAEHWQTECKAGLWQART